MPEDKVVKTEAPEDDMFL